jgi:hypothetical protein
VVGPTFLEEMEENIVKINKNLKDSQDRKKIYEYKGITHREFKVVDHVFLKVKAKISSLKLGNCSNIVVRYGEPFEILERIVPIGYMLPLHAFMCIHNVFHVSFLKKYVLDDNHIIDWNVIHVGQGEDF